MLENHSIISFILTAGLGASIGSFAGVVIDRLPRGRSVVMPRSCCTLCSKQLSLWQNLPIISWILLRGRCFFCRAPIGIRLLLVEVLFAICLISLWAKFGISFALLERIVFIFLLLCLAYIDMDTYYLPYVLLFALFAAGALSTLFYMVFPDDVINIGPQPPLLTLMVIKRLTNFFIWDRFLGAVAGFVFLSSINLMATMILRKMGRLSASQWAVGFGDSFLLAGIGFFVGLSHLILVIFLASLIGSICGLINELWAKEKRLDLDIPSGALPYGPFLALAAIYIYVF